MATGSFNPKFLNANHRSIYSVYTDGTLILNFPWQSISDSAKGFREKFKQALDSIQFCPIPDNYEDEYLNVPLAVWMPKTKAFLDVVRKVYKTDPKA